MGLKRYTKSKAAEYLAKRKESKAYQKIVTQRTLAVRRQAHEKEALKVAEEQGRAMARHPKQGFFATLGEVAITAGKRAVTPQAKKTITRRTPVRRRVTRRTTARRPARRRTRYVTVRRKAPARRRYAPVRRRIARRRTVKKTAPAREENANAWI